MPRNGSGGYSLPTNSWNPAVNGVAATTADWQSLADDIESAIQGSVAADGQTTMSGALKMGNNRITGVADAVSITDAATANDVQSGEWTYLTSVSGTNTITASLAGLTAYAAGNVFRFVVANTNTGAVTLNLNSIGAKAITKYGASALVGGELVVGAVVEVTYDGTQFQLTSADAQNVYYFEMRNSASRSTTGVFTTYTLQTSWSNGGGYVASAGSYTVPLTGVYTFTAVVGYSGTPAATGPVISGFRANGSHVGGYVNSAYGSTATNQNPKACCTLTRYFSAGDVIDFEYATTISGISAIVESFAGARIG